LILGVEKYLKLIIGAGSAHAVNSFKLLLILMSPGGFSSSKLKIIANESVKTILGQNGFELHLKKVKSINESND
jgi:hypothetical protein